MTVSGRSNLGQARFWAGLLVAMGAGSAGVVQLTRPAAQHASVPSGPAQHPGEPEQRPAAPVPAPVAPHDAGPAIAALAPSAALPVAAQPTRLADLGPVLGRAPGPVTERAPDLAMVRAPARLARNRLSGPDEGAYQEASRESLPGVNPPLATIAPLVPDAPAAPIPEAPPRPAEAAMPAIPAPLPPVPPPAPPLAPAILAPALAPPAPEPPPPPAQAAAPALPVPPPPAAPVEAAVAALPVPPVAPTPPAREEHGARPHTRLAALALHPAARAERAPRFRPEAEPGLEAASPEPAPARAAAPAPAAVPTMLASAGGAVANGEWNQARQLLMHAQTRLVFASGQAGGEQARTVATSRITDALASLQGGASGNARAMINDATRLSRGLD